MLLPLTVFSYLLNVLKSEVVFHAEMSKMCHVSLLAVAEGTKYMTNRVKLWYVPVNESEKVMEVPPMPYKSDEQEAFGRDVYDEQKAFRSKKADMPASFSQDTPGAGDVHLHQYSFASCFIVLQH